MAASIRTLRRFYRAKIAATRANAERGLEDVWRGKLNATSGTALPVDFPGLAALAALDPPYTVLEDLDGADTLELVAAGLDHKLAAAVIDAATLALA